MFLTRLKAGAVVLAGLVHDGEPDDPGDRAGTGRSRRRRPVPCRPPLPVPAPHPRRTRPRLASAKAEKPPEAGGDGGVQSKSRILTPVGKPVYVNVYTTDPDAEQKDIVKFANVFVMPRLWREGMGFAWNLGNRLFALRIRLYPRPHACPQPVVRGLIMKALDAVDLVGSPEQPLQLKEHELIYILRLNKLG